jgi:hypothetical protein
MKEAAKNARASFFIGLAVTYAIGMLVPLIGHYYKDPPLTFIDLVDSAMKGIMLGFPVTIFITAATYWATPTPPEKPKFR